MARFKHILIACPEYRVTVRGRYECNADGTYPLGPDGSYILNRVRCNQYEGRCAQTLCALHRYNNRGPGSWYPEIILTLPEKNPTSPPPKTRTAKNEQTLKDSSVSFEA